jgi:hypothetical protein
MKKYFILLLVSFTILSAKNLFAQKDSIQVTNPYFSKNKVYKVAVFAPLYLDSVFSGGNLKYQKTLPKFIMPAIDFVQGAMIAFDTIQINDKNVEAHIFDSKSYTKPTNWLIQNGSLDNFDLIIGAVREPEYSQLAQVALQKNIPFISAVYPNQGNVKQNPFTIIVNSTLEAHCEGIFDYIYQKHRQDNIYLIRKKNDTRIENYFKDINHPDSGKPYLNITTISLDSSISSQALRNRLDTTKPMVIIGASLDEVFARKLADACYPIQKTLPLTLIGMPNWDGFRSLNRRGTYKDFPILYTTPHYNVKSNAYSNFLVKQYFKLYRSKPADIAYKGFEIAYYFINILLEHPGEVMTHLNENNNGNFHDFNFQPVYPKKSTGIPDYFENKRLFMMQIMNGETTRVN